MKFVKGGGGDPEENFFSTEKFITKEAYIKKYL